jgi:hypothetical protein
MFKKSTYSSLKIRIIFNGVQGALLQRKRLINKNTLAVAAWVYTAISEISLCRI